MWLRKKRLSLIFKIFIFKYVHAYTSMKTRCDWSKIISTHISASHMHTCQHRNETELVKNCILHLLLSLSLYFFNYLFMRNTCEWLLDLKLKQQTLFLQRAYIPWWEPAPNHSLQSRRLQNHWVKKTKWQHFDSLSPHSSLLVWEVLHLLFWLLSSTFFVFTPLLFFY